MWRAKPSGSGLVVSPLYHHYKMIENKKFQAFIIIILMCLSTPLFGQFEFVGLGGKHIESLRWNGGYLYAASDNGINIHSSMQTTEIIYLCQINFYQKNPEIIIR